MRKSELLEIISHGENSGIEFKRDDIRPEQLAKEVVALVNFQGGRVLLGVEDDGTVTGIQRKNTEEWVMNVISQKIHPAILPFYEEIKIDESRSVAVITFTPGISKPYVLRHSGREDIYLRVGSTSRLATREQQMRLYELGGMLHTETLPVPKTNLESLDLIRLENYLHDIINDPEIPHTQENWVTRLSGLGFMTKASDEYYCTIAGLVLFGKNPRKFLHQSGLRVFGFKGKEKEYQAQFDEILNAPLVGRWDITDSERTLIDSGVIEKFINLIKPFISIEPNSINADFRRELNWMYPIEAVRELIINALAHRDWTRFVEIEVGSYADRFEVISPGALPNSMTVEKMLAGQRSPRNPIIMEVLRDYGYVDYRGMGIRTKIIPLMKKYNNSIPDIEATEDFVQTTLYKNKQ